MFRVIFVSPKFYSVFKRVRMYIVGQQVRSEEGTLCFAESDIFGQEATLAGLWCSWLICSLDETPSENIYLQ